MRDPVLQVIFDRATAGSRPGRRTDGHTVSLAIEGGGMRGVVSAGMCAVLETAGLVPSFDRIYGCSAGAVNGCFTAAGQAVMWATTFEDTANREFIDPVRALRRSRSGRLVGRLCTDRGRIAENLRIGASAMACALYGEPTRLMWQPMVFHPGAASGPETRTAA